MPSDGPHALPELAYEILGARGGDAAALPTRVIVMPDEKIVKARDGRVFLNDNPAGIVEMFKRRDLEVALDEHHGMDQWMGGSGRATGWILALHRVGEYGVEAEVEWTTLGERFLAERIYRYFSPTLEVENIEETGEMRVIAVIGGGLVNRPALRQRELATVQDRATDQRKNKMKQIAILLGLSEDSSSEKVLEALSANVSLVKELSASVQTLGDANSTLEAERDEAMIEVSTLHADIFDGRKDAVLKLYADRYMPAEAEHLSALAVDHASLDAVEASLKARAVLLADSGLGGSEVSEIDTRRAALKAELLRITPGLSDDAAEAAITKQLEKESN